MKMDKTVISEALAEQGYVVMTECIGAKLAEQLYQHVISLPSADFNTAKIGRQQNTQQLKTVRNDKIVWLSKDNTLEQAYLNKMKALRIHLNRQLFLGLRNFEAHFAHYPPGHFYQRHVDAFKGQSNRIVSSALYLNPDWTAEDGGQLVLYHNNGSHLQTILPHFGHFVLFLSEQFPHEVLPTKRDRYSIAGWFRTDDAIL